MFIVCLATSARINGGLVGSLNASFWPEAFTRFCRPQIASWR
jgi:hypothetical protein